MFRIGDIVTPNEGGWRKGLIIGRHYIVNEIEENDGDTLLSLEGTNIKYYARRFHLVKNGKRPLRMGDYIAELIKSYK